MGTDKRFSDYGVCELAKIEPSLNQKRYYGISVQPGLFEVILHRQWGRLGCRPRSMNEYFDSIELAVAKANSLYGIKTRRGYREV